MDPDPKEKWGVGGNGQGDNLQRLNRKGSVVTISNGLLCRAPSRTSIPYKSRINTIIYTVWPLSKYTRTSLSFP